MNQLMPTLTQRTTRVPRLFILALLLYGSGGTHFQTHAQITAAPSATPTPDAPKPVGTITGRVVGEGGQPVANARVFAYSRRGAQFSNAAAISDTEGRFTLNQIERGVYTISAYAPGYFDEANLELDAGRRNYYRPGDTARIALVRGGVITGRVTNANGEPVIATRVNLVRVRDAQGRPVRELNVFSRPLERLTDDLGVYRVYGLLPGAYLISAGGKLAFGYQASPYEHDAPTYYPSTTRDGATEVVVQAGQEVGAIDIRYRGEPGHAVGGVVVGAGKPAAGEGPAFLSLITSGTTAVEGFNYFGQGGEDTFSFAGLGDGEYDLVAERVGLNSSNKLKAATQHVTIRGADVTGLRLILTPLASVAGRVVFAPNATGSKPEAHGAPACPTTANAPRAEEIVILAIRDARDANRSTGRLEGAYTAEGVPDDKGDFTISGMDAGRYRLDVQLPGDDLYLRSLNFDRAANTATTSKPDATNAKPNPATTTATAANDPARVGLRLGAGEQISGLVVNVARGAASLRGRIASSIEGTPPPDRLRVYLLPAEPESTDDVIRFYDTDARVDGTFSFKHVAPGRYLVVARPAPSTADSAAPAPPPLAWDAPARAALRREAAAANNTLDLAPCQRATDYRLAYTLLK